MDYIQDQFYWWCFRILWKIRSGKQYGESSLPNLRIGWNAKDISAELLQNWEMEIQKKEPKLLYCLLKTYGKSYLFSFFLLFISQCVLPLTVTMIFGSIIQSINIGNVNSGNIESKVWNPWIQGIIFALLQILCNFIYVRAIYRNTSLSLKIRVGLISILYKVLLNSNQESQATFSRLNTIIANDLTKLDSALRNIPYLILCFFQFFIGFFVLLIYFESSELMGLVVLILIVLSQAWLSRLSGMIYQQIAVQTDGRVKLLREILGSINYIKMSVLEYLFYKDYIKRRGSEMELVHRRNIFLFLPFAFYEVGTKLIILGTIIFMFTTSKGSFLLPANIFVLITLYTTIYDNIGVNLPSGISVFYELLVTIKRVQDFLSTNSLDQVSTVSQVRSTSTHEVLLELQNVSISSLGLQNLNLIGKAKQLIVITGGVGTGKSLILRTILGEFAIDKGNLERRGTISYCPQTPWVYNASIRDNIVLGNKFIPEWYSTVLKACALDQDLHALPNGDQTLVSDGCGTGTLSGGQKTRINLARSIYADSDILVLDDPFTSLDIKVAKEVLTNCIFGILKLKLVILVTHSLECFHKASACFIVVERTLHTLEKEKAEEELGVIQSEIAEASGSVQLADSIEEKGKSLESDKVKAYGTFTPPESQEESFKQDSVGWKTIYNYLKVGNSGAILFMGSFIIIFAQLLLNYSNIWLAIWVNSGNYAPNYYMNIYTLLIFIGTAFTVARALSILEILHRSSSKTHDSMILSVLKTPLEFFYANTSGRILNRFTSDTIYMDEFVPQGIYVTISMGLEAIGGAIVAVIAVDSILVVLFFIIIGWMIIWIRGLYVQGVAVIGRIEGRTRSPILSHLIATYSGLLILKTSSQQNYFWEKFYLLQDANSRAVFVSNGLMPCFSLYLLLLMNFFLFVVLFLSLWIGNGGAQLGLALTSVFTVVTKTAIAVNQSAKITKFLVAVERGMEYMELRQEDDHLNSHVRNWPSNGSINFDQITLIYPNNTVGLRNVSFTVSNGQRIGIVGRTGSGKSSLLMSLFRLASLRAGSIHIDCLDINTLRLRDLRKAMSILPQNPVLLSGTIRKNMDPFNEHSDLELWNVFSNTGLSKKFQSLDQELSEDGERLSEGEKQLLLLGRIILQKSRIVVLDEPTSNVDRESEIRILEILHESLPNSTILMIAHKLDCVMDFDRILFLEGGEVSEYDTPLSLLENPNSNLSQLVQSSGKRGWKEEILTKLRRVT